MVHFGLKLYVVTFLEDEYQLTIFTIVLLLEKFPPNLLFCEFGVHLRGNAKCWQDYFALKRCAKGTLDCFLNKSRLHDILAKKGVTQPSEGSDPYIVNCQHFSFTLESDLKRPPPLELRKQTG